MRYQKGGAFLESIQRYWKRTDKVYLLLCLFSSGMAVLALASWAAKQGNGFAVDGLTGQITGVGDYRRAMVQAGAAAIGIGFRPAGAECGQADGGCGAPD